MHTSVLLLNKFVLSLRYRAFWLRGIGFCLFVLWCTWFCAPNAFAQLKFDETLLDNPKLHGEQISNQFKTYEIPTYTCNNKRAVYLTNGFKTVGFTNPEDWEDIRDTVLPYRIDLVYSKYPIRNGKYSEIYPLLCQRLTALFELDPELNDSTLIWNKFLQTQGDSEQQFNKLFHGVVIWYHLLLAEETPLISALKPESKQQNSPAQNFRREALSEQSSFKKLVESVDYIKSSASMPDSVRASLSDQPVEDQIESIKLFLEADMKKLDGSKATAEDVLRCQKEIDAFLSKFPARDSVVQRVLTRHPEWRDVLVVNDWTGSMYGYGAQVLAWHLSHLNKSGIISMTLFNDGDNKKEKIIGNTGGIYTVEADNPEKLIRMFNYVMLQGSGGDIPENDIEGILKAMERQPNFKEIVLIADNNACVRDISISDKIQKPVRIILCGYNPRIGINPDFVYLAKTTGGGIYTIEDDLDSINVETDPSGMLLSAPDTRFKIIERMCNSPSIFSSDSIQIRDYNWARRHPRKTAGLALANKSMGNIPDKIFRMKHLQYLDLSHNNIKLINPDIDHLQVLRKLNLCDNQLTALPEEFKLVRHLEQLDLSHNQFLVIPRGVMGLKQLKVLDLSYNQIKKFDRNFSAHQLETLSLSHNFLKEITRSISSLRQLKNLDLSFNQLQKLPDNFMSLSKLERLDLSFNRLTEMPQQLYKFKQLQVLNLQGNNFSEEEKARILKSLPNTVVNF